MAADDATFHLPAVRTDDALRQFHKNNPRLVWALYLVILVNLVMFLWAVLALAGVPVAPRHFDRYNFENWQALVTESLIMFGGALGWRRGQKDCLLLTISLIPAAFIDLVHRFWDPIAAPALKNAVGFVLPAIINNAIHFNGALTWIALPLVVSFALSRRAFMLHLNVLRERQTLEERVPICFNNQHRRHNIKFQCR